MAQHPGDLGPQSPVPPAQIRETATQAARYDASSPSPRETPRQDSQRDKPRGIVIGSGTDAGQKTGRRVAKIAAASDTARCPLHGSFHHAFLSYRRSDGEDLACHLAEALSARGVDFFWDPVRNRPDPSLYSGVAGALYRALRMCETTWCERCLDSIAQTPDPQRFQIGKPNFPYSPMEGKAGLLYAYVSLQRPDQSSFPGYEGAT